MLRLCVLVATFLYPQIAARKRNHMFTVKVGPFELRCRLAIRRNHFNMLSGSTLKKRCCVESSSFGHGCSPRAFPEQECELACVLEVIKIHNAISAPVFERRSGSSPNAFQQCSNWYCVEIHRSLFTAQLPRTFSGFESPPSDLRFAAFFLFFWRRG